MKFLGRMRSISQRFHMAGTSDRLRTTSRASNGYAREAPAATMAASPVALGPSRGQSRPRTLRIAPICQLHSQTTRVFSRVHLFATLPNKFFLDINFVSHTIKCIRPGSAPDSSRVNLQTAHQSSSRANGFKAEERSVNRRRAQASARVEG